MKILHCVSIKLVMIAIACSFAASAPIQAQEPKVNSASGDNPRLVVTRAANFGTFEFIDLFVDGVQVADLGFNQKYDGVLSPGQHVVSITTEPNDYLEKPSERRVSAKPGQTYAFTSPWKDAEDVSLEQ